MQTLGFNFYHIQLVSYARFNFLTQLTYITRSLATAETVNEAYVGAHSVSL